MIYQPSVGQSKKAWKKRVLQHTGKPKRSFQFHQAISNSLSCIKWFCRNFHSEHVKRQAVRLFDMTSQWWTIGWRQATGRTIQDSSFLQRRFLQHAGKSLRSCRKDCTCVRPFPSSQHSGSWFRLDSIFSVTRDYLWHESSSFWLERHLWSHLKADIQVRSKRFLRCQILGILDPSLMETVLETTSLWM